MAGTTSYRKAVTKTLQRTVWYEKQHRHSQQAGIRQVCLEGQLSEISKTFCSNTARGIQASHYFKLPLQDQGNETFCALARSTKSKRNDR